jgi:hypothetical protein
VGVKGLDACSPALVLTPDVDSTPVAEVRVETKQQYAWMSAHPTRQHVVRLDRGQEGTERTGRPGRPEGRPPKHPTCGADPVGEVSVKETGKELGKELGKEPRQELDEDVDGFPGVKVVHHIPTVQSMGRQVATASDVLFRMLYGTLLPESEPLLSWYAEFAVPDLTHSVRDGTLQIVADQLVANVTSTETQRKRLVFATLVLKGLLRVEDFPGWMHTTSLKPGTLVPPSATSLPDVVAVDMVPGKHADQGFTVTGIHTIESRARENLLANARDLTRELDLDIFLDKLGEDKDALERELWGSVSARGRVLVKQNRVFQCMEVVPLEAFPKWCRTQRWKMLDPSLEHFHVSQNGK